MALALTNNEKGIGMELKKTVRLLNESREEAVKAWPKPSAWPLTLATSF